MAAAPAAGCATAWDATPMFVHCCHCQDCQRQTGTAFVLNALIETDRVELLSGDPDAHPRCRPTAAGRTSCSAARTAAPRVWSEYGGADQAALRPRRHAGRPDRAAAGRAHLYALEAALGRAAGGRAGVRGVLQRPRSLAGREPGAAQGGTRLIRLCGRCAAFRRLRGLLAARLAASRRRHASRQAASPPAARPPPCRARTSSTDRPTSAPCRLQHRPSSSAKPGRCRPAVQSRRRHAAGTAARADDRAARRRRTAPPRCACTSTRSPGSCK